ncbi:hypothetical protein MHUMG1_01591 [Metarhizium humberi]|uniref:Uncharacterized protein n=1 Tax=Metarhizium humberi TaxID=2596975 RepID=A0A9P8MHM2_9HYPO|nr:hypothetical protein MHUMG1_01591 [Metarhizium humberi]
MAQGYAVFIGLVIIVALCVASWFLAPKGQNQVALAGFFVGMGKKQSNVTFIHLLSFALPPPQPTANRPAQSLANITKAQRAFPSAATLLSPMESTSPRPAAVNTSLPTAHLDAAPAIARMQAV